MSLRAVVRRRWPPLRLRAILFGVLLLVAGLPGVAAISLRVYENTLVRQTEAELVAQGAALAAAASQQWPGTSPDRRPFNRRALNYYVPEPTTIDLSRSPVLPERPPPRPTRRGADRAALTVAYRMDPVIEQTTRTTLASILLLDRNGVIVRGRGYGRELSMLPEVRDALAGQPRTVFRESGDYQPSSPLEWLSRAASLRLHHARPIVADGEVVGVLLLSRSPRALFRGLYEDRGKIALGAGVIFALLVLMAGLVSRGVTRPIEALSAASRRVAAGGGDIPETPATAAVEIRQLYEDFRAMAERIERRSGYLRDFAAAVSHEFKTPLAGISGAVELLQDHLEAMSPQERQRFLSNIAADAGRLSQLVGRLLDLARADMATPEAGVAVAVEPPVRRAADGQAADGYQIAVDLPAGLPPVAAPEAAIETVLNVLLQNARQAGASQARITAAAGAVELVLSVTDDGPGVPPADRERLFEPFFTSRRAEGGTGLGLSIARSLLAASHGRLTLEPSARGARFDVALPLA
ncbi:ATP-binding protein [Phenylobacterium sp.]|uniref:sensor histidine kinase n=1 Tax=Phenylobacterium sp. TaxID=1871053 RepID=UPI0035AFAA82